ncbi:hypothetical protein JMJ77_0000847 [Colletotrichum scovillei]|uniref:Uncharacterized protein n=1 Tax=Colletotrichum scovillei TaxID=1209932 RepID=A0A9P7RB02_9PEZI|nr:hypothetical protein JMJ77_0000847 [Colletotrichum scovillei]KAG7072059.1 hypothetical protein JMJ76_0004921 [Colletotrichum scovillei]KAG7080211.1 hypothetical protein JMJ78_0007311 [Colletotrichum scovillei]
MLQGFLSLGPSGKVRIAENVSQMEPAVPKSSTRRTFGLGCDSASFGAPRAGGRETGKRD